MLKATVARVSLLCALVPLASACVESAEVVELAGGPLNGALEAAAAQGSAQASAYIFPRQATLFGESYEAWAASWWQWVLAIPSDVNPNLGGPCDVDQSGQVFFLGGNFGGQTTRSCAMPAGKAIFFPILNAFSVNCPEYAGGSYTCEIATSEVYPHESTTSLMNLGHTLSLSIDGVAVEGLEEYRAHTDTWSVPGPGDGEAPLSSCSGPIRDNPCGVPVGSTRYGASDGYWVMLRPLPPGEHQIRFTASVPSFPFSLDITYSLVVSP